MIDLTQYEVWFVTGSQHLYGEDALHEVAANAELVAAALDCSDAIPTAVVCKPVMTTPEAIHELCLEASRTDRCVGLVAKRHRMNRQKGTP